MLTKNLGGIEQVFLDYNEALEYMGHDVIPIMHAKSPLKSNNIKTIRMKVANGFDLFAVLRLWRLIRKHKPDCIITHSTKPTRLIKMTCTRKPIIAVSHNFNFKKLLKAPYIIAITKYMKDIMILAGKRADNIQVVPNLIKFNELPKFKSYRKVPIIGFLGNLFYEKGPDIFIRSLKILKDRNVKFKIKIGGEGDSKVEVERLISEFGLSDDIEILGWVDEKKKFFESIDIFCFPSRTEIFGLVMIEAFKYGKPVVTTNSKGPLEIGTDNYDAVFAQPDDIEDLANKLQLVIENQALGKKLVLNATKTLQKYSFAKIAKMLDKSIRYFVQSKKRIK